MDLQRLWEWFYSSRAIDILRNARYAIPLIQSFHLFGLTLVLGTTVTLNARLLGIGMRKIPIPVMAKQLWHLGIGGLWLSVVTGILVFIPDPARYAANSAFKIKLVILVTAILFHFTIFRNAVRSNSPPAGPRNILIAAVSLTLWFSVGWAGRAIAFLG